MAFSRIQSKVGNAGAYSNTNVQSFTSNVTSGSLILVGITASALDTIVSVADNLGNTYVNVSSVADERRNWLYYVKNAIGGSLTLTVTYAASTFPDSVITMVEYGGMDTVSPKDVHAVATDGGNYVQSHTGATTAATSQADELVVVVGGTGGSTSPGFSAGSGYTNLIVANGFDAFTYGLMAEKVVASTGTQYGNYTSTEFVRGQVIVSTFKIAGVVPPANLKPNFFAFF